MHMMIHSLRFKTDFLMKKRIPNNIDNLLFDVSIGHTILTFNDFNK